MRRTENINSNWFFAKTDVVPDAVPDTWEQVTLPHTWNAKDGQDGGNDYYRGVCMYARVMEKMAPAKDERIFLEFQGAAMTADVYLGRTKLAHHEGGYSTFRVDVTEYMAEDQLLCVAVDNGVNDRVYPQKADFTFYGGLYRNVNLIGVPENHFELIKDGTPGIKVTPQVEGSRAVIRAEAWVNGEGTVRFRIEEANAETTVRAEDGYACAELQLEDVRLWNGIKDPYLYTMKAELLLENADYEKNPADSVSARFGCRTISFDKDKGFFLNGKSYPLRGVSRHQDREGAGNALTPEMHREDMDLIREIGANTIRLAHYQHAQEFYDLCDEYGMVVWAEIPYITQHMPNGRENTLSQMKELITQCYNHPSIVCWGLSNEITANGSVTEDMLENHRQLNDLCHRMDQTRPTTMAHVFMLETDNSIIDIPDIGSYNLYFGWYIGDLSQNDRFFDEYHEKYPERIIGFSEYGADANPRFQTAHPEIGDYSEQYQALYHEHILRCIEERPYLWATHVWNMFDFAADGRDEGGAHGVNQKGLVSMDRKLKKDAFYLYKAAWSKEAFVHICGKRYADRTEDMTEVKVYSNQPEVTLLVDGEIVKRQEGKRVFVFQVPLTGEHLIRAMAGDCMDTAVIRKVSQPNPDYLFQKEAVVNWFDREEINPECFSIQDTMGEVMANPAGAAILGRIIAQASASRGDVAASTEGNANLEKMMAGMKIQSLLKQAGDAVKPEQIKQLNEALQQIKKQ
jgi:beta-galactosidase